MATSLQRAHGCPETMGHGDSMRSRDRERNIYSAPTSIFQRHHSSDSPPRQESREVGRAGERECGGPAVRGCTRGGTILGVAGAPCGHSTFLYNARQTHHPPEASPSTAKPSMSCTCATSLQHPTPSHCHHPRAFPQPNRRLLRYDQQQAQRTRNHARIPHAQRHQSTNPQESQDA